EDGIRDFHVTGVQTCALPISAGLSVATHIKTSLAPGSRIVADYLAAAGLLEPLACLGFDLVGFGCTTCVGNSGPLDPAVEAAIRSEERRVGKEWRLRRGPYRS